MPVPGLSLLGLKRIRGFVSILRYINPTIIIIICFGLCQLLQYSIIASCHSVLVFVSQSVNDSGMLVKLVSQGISLVVSPFIHSLNFKFFCVLAFFKICIKHSLTHSLKFCCIWGVREVWNSVFFADNFLEDLGGPEKGLFGVSTPDKELCRLICKHQFSGRPRLLVIHNKKGCWMMMMMTSVVGVSQSLLEVKVLPLGLAEQLVLKLVEYPES